MIFVIEWDHQEKGRELQNKPGCCDYTPRTKYQEDKLYSQFTPHVQKDVFQNFICKSII